MDRLLSKKNDGYFRVQVLVSSDRIVSIIAFDLKSKHNAVIFAGDLKINGSQLDSSRWQKPKT